MRTALDSISKSLARVRDISVDIDKNVLKALKDTALLERHDTMQCALTVSISRLFRKLPNSHGRRVYSRVVFKEFTF